MFYSQDKQDQYLENNIFKGFKNGVFMDVGAHDGISFNNTFFFEQNHNWTGINVEPIQKIFERLIINRPTSINVNCAVSDNNGIAEFICNKGYTEMLSGLQSTYHKDHFIRLEKENLENGGATEIITVNTKRIETICDENNIKHINYLSIDVEGAEFNVIKSINFDKLFIDVIGFENNYNDSSVEIITYLESKNYVKLNHLSIDIFMIHKNSSFYNNIS
jgi:FkbM family methyltransferase